MTMWFLSTNSAQNISLYFKTTNNFYYLKYKHQHLYWNKFWAISKFRFFKLFWIKKLSKNKQKLLSDRSHRSLFSNFNTFLQLKKNIQNLIGLKMTARFTNFKWKKKWFIRHKQFFIKLNKTRKKLFKNLKFTKFLLKFTSTNLDLHDNFPKKYLYYSFFFKLFKLNLSYKDFKYVLRRVRNKYPVHFTAFKFKTPYTFLNLTRKTSKPFSAPLTTLFFLYKFYKKIFKTFKRLHYSKFKNKKTYFFQFSTNNRVLKYNSKKLYTNKTKKFYKANSTVSILLHQNYAMLKNNAFSNPCFDNFTALAKNIVVLKKMIKNNNKFIISKLKKYKYSKYFLKNNKIFSKTVIGTIQISPLKLFTFFHKFIRIKPHYFYVNDNSKIHVLDTIKKNYNFSNSMFFKSYSLNYFNNFSKILSSSKRFMTFAPFYSKHFNLNQLGFLFLSCRTTSKFTNRYYPQLFKLRKTIYSFIKKNDLPKYILRKYSYFKIANSITKFFKLKKKFKQFKKPPFSSNAHKQNFKISNFAVNSSCSNSSAIVSLFEQRNSFRLKKLQTKFKKHFIKKSFNIFLFKFKPGYMKQWRLARADVRLQLPKVFRYQHQLTTYLTTYKKATQIESYLMIEMQLINLIKRVRLVFDTSIAHLIISHNNIFVNGLVCSNPFFVLFLNDFVQLIVSFKYYILFKWMLNASMKTKSKWKRKSKLIKKKKDLQNPDKHYRNALPQSVVAFDMLFADVVKYVELDFFTLSFFVLYDPFLFYDINNENFIVNRYHIYNMYNWKYIT